MADQDVIIQRGEDVVLRTKSGRIIARIRYVPAPSVIRKTFSDSLYITQEKKVLARVIPKAAMLDRHED